MHARIEGGTLLIHPIRMVWRPYHTEYTHNIHAPSGGYGFTPCYATTYTYHIPTDIQTIKDLSPEQLIRFVHTHLDDTQKIYRTAGAAISLLRHTLPHPRMIDTTSTYTDDATIDTSVQPSPTIYIKQHATHEHTHIHTYEDNPFINVHDPVTNINRLTIQPDAPQKHSLSTFRVENMHTPQDIMQSLCTSHARIQKLLHIIHELFLHHNIYINDERDLCLDHGPDGDPITILPQAMMDAYMGHTFVHPHNYSAERKNIWLYTLYNQALNTFLNRFIRRQKFQRPHYMTNHNIIQSIRTMHAFMVSHTP